MRHGPNDSNVLFNRDEEFRQLVIRQAILLGFEGEEYADWPSTRPVKRWRFTCTPPGGMPNSRFGSYATLYNAAFDYLRVMNIPTEVIGVVRNARDEGKDKDTSGSR